jgi:hypothetical protein
VYDAVQVNEAPGARVVILGDGHPNERGVTPFPLKAHSTTSTPVNVTFPVFRTVTENGTGTPATNSVAVVVFDTEIDGRAVE